MFSYTADENGYHPIMTEEAAPSLVANRAVQTMFSSDVPEEFQVTLTEEDVELAKKRAQETRARSKQIHSESVFASSAPSEQESIESGRLSKSIQADSTAIRKRVFTNSH